MNNKYIIKNVINGKFFVANKGFVATIPSEATKYDLNSAELNSALAMARALGFSVTTQEFVPVDPNIVQNADGSSYTVHYIRKGQVNIDGSVQAHKNNPSKRNFATQDEAIHHASRFMKSEGHLGFFVIKVQARVNSYVNKVTGLTNPEL